MRSSGSSFTNERKGIICGAAISLSLFLSLTPLVVQAQTLPEEFDVPLRPQMQLPICGKIEPVSNLSTRTRTKETVTYPLTVTPLSDAQPAAKKLAKLPVGSFNQTQHVKEFSWLPEDSSAEISDQQPTKEHKSSPSIQQVRGAVKTAVKIQPERSSNDASDVDSESESVQSTTVKPATKETATVHSKTETAEGSSKVKSLQAASASKEHKIEPAAVKVAKQPHCSGVADYYADQFHGRKTASGQLHDREKFTAAHRSLPFGSKLKVVNRNTGKACIVTVNDRGPFTKNRIIDLSSAAARELGLLTAKSRLVDCYLVENE